MNAKFEFTGKTKVVFGITLNQIRAVADFVGVVKGEIGGWIEAEANLQVSGNAWVSGNAQVSGNARVFGNAQVSGNAWVSGDAWVSGNAQVSGNARVFGNAWVFGNARVFGNAQVSGNAWVSGNAQVSGNAWVSGDASPEEIMRLDEVREIVLAKPERLKMDTWHSSKWDSTHTPEEEHGCGSAHCIAGWLQALSPDEKLRQMEAQEAAMSLAPVAAASGIFFVDDAMAFEWLKDRRYAKQTEAA